MALLGRGAATEVNYNGEISSVRSWEITHNLPKGVFKSEFLASGYKEKFTNPDRVVMGRRLLALHMTCLRRIPPVPTPILVRFPAADREATPQRVGFLGSALDPAIAIDLDSKRYHLLYWVNAWSDSSALVMRNPRALFSKGREPEDTQINSLNNFALEKDLPDDPRMDTLEESAYGVSPITGEVGLFDPTEFYVAPWASCYLSRVDIAELLKEGETPPEGFSTIRDPNTVFFKRVKFLLRRVLRGEFITDMDKNLLEEAGRSIRRLANLTRCTRVLMYTTGEIHHLTWSPSESTSERFNWSSLRDYLVVDNPQPVYWETQQSNKVLAARPKWTSYLNGEDSFVTAPLNFRFPAAASTTVVRNCPQLDFSLSDGGDWRWGVRSGITLPLSRDTQRSPVAPAKDVITVPITGISLIEIMSLLG